MMRILIATDGSPYADVALRLGSYLWRERPAAEPPTLLTVIKREADRPLADSNLARAREALHVPTVRTKVRVGSAGEEILHEAEEGAYDLLIIGQSRERHPITRLLESSTAIQVAERASCPVLIAKGRIGPIRRLLLCDSGAPSRSILNRLTAQLAEVIEGEEEVTVLHVMSQMSAGPGVQGKELRASAEELMEEHTPEGELLEQDIQLLEKPHIHPHPQVRHGLVVDEILAEAQSGDYDLVVIGAHPGEGWQRLLLDDLAREIILHLDRPVLVVR
jgi:nucleotide-binding universal stress UspA family protein